MSAIVDVVLPVFAIVLAGWLAARFSVLGRESTDALNRFVFFVAMPVLIFHAVARLEPSQLFDWHFIAAFVGSSLVTMTVAGIFAATVFRRTLAESTLSGMSGVFGNTVYMGIPICLIAFGDEALTPAIVAGVSQGAILIVPVIVLVEFDRRGAGGGSAVVRDLVATLIRNPLIIAPALGLLWSATGADLPTAVDNFCSILGSAAGPCALFALGLFLYGKPLHEGKAEVGSIVVIKLVLQPVVAWIFLYHVFDVPPLAADVGLLLAALPTGANCFVLAQQYGCFVHRTSSAILISTVFAVITISLLFVAGLPGVR